MSYTGEIKTIEKERHQATNKNFLDVKFDIKNEDDKVVRTKRIALDPNASKEEVLEEIEKLVKAYEGEQKRRVKQRKIDKQDENVKELKDLEGQKVGD